MSNILEQASLVLVPSGYKAGTVYSQIPIDGEGDLQFTRALQTATRVGSDGLIEKVRTNLVLHSQDPTNAVWVKNAGATITSNTTIAPDGTLTADTLNVATTVFSGIYQAISSTSNAYTVSLFVKKGTKDFIYLFDLSVSGTAWFNLTNNTLGAVTAGFTATITSVGDGWVRITMRRDQAVTPAFFQIGLSDADGVSTPASTGTAFIWGAQAEVSDFGATPYIPTTTAAVSVGMLANVPRLDYLGGGCPKLLLEPQRTNLNTFSDGFTNGWTSSGATITATANFGISPDGFQNSTRLQFSAANLIWRKTISGLTGNVGTWSVYIKGTAGQTINITYGGVDLLVTLGSGFNRFSVTATGTIDEVFLNTFGGATARDIEVYGGQAEVGSYATSYIPTLGAAVTRSADAAEKTGISALIGQTQGTIYWEFEFSNSVAAGHESIINIDNGSFGNTIYILKGATGGITAEMYVAGVAQSNFSLAAQPAGTYKAAFGYANNNTAFFINGVQVGTTDTSCSVPATSRIQLGNGVFGASTDKTAQAVLFPTRLSNTQLIELTTP